MSSFEKIMIVFISILLLSMSYAVLKTASIQEEKMKERTERRHLPTECEQYYNDGTDNWKECMKVEYK